MELAGKISLRTEVETFSLAEANHVLLMMKQSKLRGAGVLAVD
jgi:propanol-preferring alcohol dehydrogenase